MGRQGSGRAGFPSVAHLAEDGRVGVLLRKASRMRRWPFSGPGGVPASGARRRPVVNTELPPGLPVDLPMGFPVAHPRLPGTVDNDAMSAVQPRTCPSPSTLHFWLVRPSRPTGRGRGSCRSRCRSRRPARTFETIGETRRGVDHDRGRIHFAQEAQGGSGMVS